ncbi:MAG: hypothetical protein MJ078_02015 [Clostridia bacterium]|nr:hypothetical protein [Clostridia bacterium]
MKSLLRSRFKWLVILILTLALSAVAIPLIVYAVIKGYFLLFIICLGVLTYAMYSTQLFFWLYRRCNFLLSLLDCVQKENLFDTKSLSKRLFVSEEKIEKDLQICLKKRYLSGYAFFNGQLVPIVQ